MQEYLIYYVQDIGDNEEVDFNWKCMADSYDHAIEQLRDAEKNIIYYELVSIR